MRTYTDHEIEHWGRLFTASGLFQARGVTFERFLNAPHVFMSAERAERLRDATHAAERAVEAQVPGARVRDGAFFQPRHYCMHAANGLRRTK